MGSKASLQEKLKEQYKFLKRSIQAVMDGHEEEALRIATTIRVLVHETGASTPLLKQMDANYLQLTILDVPPPGPSRPGGQVLFYIGVGVQMNTKTGLRPIIDVKNSPVPRQQLVVLGNWWNQVILIFTNGGERIVFTRRQLILTLANKEGGAHVDTTLPAAYEKFVIQSPLKFAMNNVPTDTVHLARYAAVQAAAQLCECLERHFPGINS